MRIGIDLGGTKTEGILLDDEKRTIIRLRKKTPQEQGYQAILDNISDIVNQLQSHIQEKASIGIATPGSIDAKSGLVKYANTVCLNDRALKSDLQSTLSTEVRIENDANCLAVSEFVDGAAKNKATLFAIILGTGVGGGIIVNGNVIKGLNGLAGEWGHSQLKPSQSQCYCGLSGCVETYLSGPGVINRYIKHGGKTTDCVETIVESSLNNDPIAQKTLTEFYANFTKAISTIIKILDPEIIVVGGGLSQIDTLYDYANHHINSFFSHPINTRIVKSLHGDSSGVRGAALLWDEKLRYD